MGQLYRWLWTRLGGRPWTWIVRDYQKQNPLLVMLAFLAFGLVLGALGFWWGLILFIIGIVIGHYWW